MMSMKKKRTITAVVISLIALTFFVLYSSEAQRKKPGLILTGVVVGYDESLSLVNVTSAPQLQVLIVRIVRSLKGHEESRYIKVVYQYMHNDPTLPKEIVDGKTQWRFELTRAAAQDQSCMGPLQGLKQTPGADAEEIPNDSNLPCYVLQPGGIKLDSNKK